MAEKPQQDSLQPNNPLSKRLNKILETRFDNDKEMLEALRSLSDFFTENNLRSRRNLRGDIEKRSLAINENFVDSFKTVKEQLDSVYNDVKAMNDCCQDMTTRLKNAKEQTHDLIDQTTRLQAESQKLEMRAKVADAFLEKFQLKPDELEVLRGQREGALHGDFFKALARVKEIHTDCKMLLRTNQQTAGLEIMEAMAMHQESAYERLYRWAQNECRSLTGDSPDVSSQLCQAMAALYDRPVLFKYTIDEFGTARRTAIVRGFIDALTRGGSGGSARPIELHSHDPLRYTGDMLAWLHQATASEKEHIQMLVKLCAEKGLNDQIVNVLSHITEGLCRPFKVRIEQVLVSEPGAVTLYKLANLIKFYQTTIGNILDPQSPLLGSLEEMYKLSMSMFFNSLAMNANKLIEKVELPPADLGATSVLNKTLQLLQDILSSHDASLLPLSSRKQALAQVTSCVIDPLLQMCTVSASRLNTTDMASYMINCLHLIQTTLTLYEFTDQRLEMLQAQVDAHVDTLISEQAGYALNRAGLALVYDRLQTYSPAQGPFSQQSNMDADSLRAVMSTFDSYLASPDSATLPQCSLLLSSKARETIKKRALEIVTQCYEQLYNIVNTPENQYTDPQRILPRSPQQVKQLLS